MPAPGSDNTSQFVEASLAGASLGHIEDPDWDPSRMRISGTATQAMLNGQDGYFDVPAISHVEGALWQGGCLPNAPLPKYIQQVYSLYPWGQWLLPEGCEREEFKLYDSADQGFEQVDEIASKVVKSLAEGKITLVHCQAGLNRSALIAGTALVKLGRSGDEVVDLLREKRHQVVLCNPAFEEYLRSL